MDNTAFSSSSLSHARSKAKAGSCSSVLHERDHELLKVILGLQMKVATSLSELAGTATILSDSWSRTWAAILEFC